jgi:hypothetical protein
MHRKAGTTLSARRGPSRTDLARLGRCLAVFRPVEYLKVVAVIVSKCTDLSLSDDMRDAALEEIIEERRQAALLQIEKMREEDTRAAWPNEHD